MEAQSCNLISLYAVISTTEIWQLILILHLKSIANKEKYKTCLYKI